MFRLASKDPTKYERQCDRWEKIRQKGKTRFLLLRGVLGYGGFMYLFMVCARVFVSHERLAWPYMLISCGWFVAGYFWGIWIWRWYDDEFHGAENRSASILPR
ncbi:MAG TPA: hypothetical protein VMV39_03555 [Terracidiphilus sp.]|nr:hypothetical protein [Terracidiphilus sp.]